jgi:hypothetical protein
LKKSLYPGGIPVSTNYVRQSEERVGKREIRGREGHWIKKNKREGRRKEKGKKKEQFPLQKR